MDHRIRQIEAAVAARDPETLDVAEALWLLAVIIGLIERPDNNAEELGRHVLGLRREVTNDDA